MHEEEYIDKDYSKFIRTPAKTEPYRFFPDNSDIKNFYQTINRIYKNNDARLQNMTIFKAYPKLGLRFRELINLNYEDVDFKNNKLILKKTKNKDQAVMDMDGELKTLIENYINYFNIKEEALFRGRHGRRIERHVIYDNFNKIKKAAGLSNSFTPHCFRRYFITTLDKNNVRFSLIQKLARHRDPKTTLMYIEHNDKEKIDAMSKINLSDL